MTHESEPSAAATIRVIPTGSYREAIIAILHGYRQALPLMDPDPSDLASPAALTVVVAVGLEADADAIRRALQAAHSAGPLVLVLAASTPGRILDTRAPLVQEALPRCDAVILAAPSEDSPTDAVAAAAADGGVAIARLTTVMGEVEADVQELLGLLRQAKLLYLGTGTASEDEGVVEATKQALVSGFAGRTPVGARQALLVLEGPAGVPIDEVTHAAALLQAVVGDEAEIMFATSHDRRTAEVRAIVVLGGWPDQPR